MAGQVLHTKHLLGDFNTLLRVHVGYGPTHHQVDKLTAADFPNRISADGSTVPHDLHPIGYRIDFLKFMRDVHHRYAFGL